MRTFTEGDRIVIVREGKFDRQHGYVHRVLKQEKPIYLAIKVDQGPTIVIPAEEAIRETSS